MLLRESSARTGATLDLQAVTDASLTPGLHRGEHLSALADAAIRRDWHRLTALSKAAEVAIGTEAVRDTLVVAAGFNGITRVADATGIPLDPPTAAATAELRHTTGIDSFDYGEKSRRFD